MQISHQYFQLSHYGHQKPLIMDKNLNSLIRS